MAHEAEGVIRNGTGPDSSLIRFPENIITCGSLLIHQMIDFCISFKGKVEEKHQSGDSSYFSLSYLIDFFH